MTSNDSKENSTNTRTSKISQNRNSAEDPRAVTLNYEYQETPAVKLNLSPSELQFLDDDDKSQLTQASTTSSMIPTTGKPDRNGNRFIASVSVLLTFGILSVGINAAFMMKNYFPFLSVLVVFFSFLVYEWQRIHGMTLSRKLRPVLNMSSVFATYKHFNPDSAGLYAANKDKYIKWACCNVPEIDSELPRTADEKSPSSSPPNANSVKHAETSKEAVSSSKTNKSDGTQTQSAHFEALQPKDGVEIKFSSGSNKEL